MRRIAVFMKKRSWPERRNVTSDTGPTREPREILFRSHSPRAPDLHLDLSNYQIVIVDPKLVRFVVKRAFVKSHPCGYLAPHELCRLLSQRM